MTMEELAWILIPALAVVGWLGYHLFKQRKKTSPLIPKGYVNQLNNLLAQRHNKAVDTFIDLFAVNADTVETHIMFGNLFRQRGETEKAIRIHQNVINKTVLESYHCAEAMLELARDYFDAGLYDRAERLLRDAMSLRKVPIQVEVCHQLIRLYEIEKNWLEAIAVAGKLQKLMSTAVQNNHIAHYYCELAEEAIAAGNYYGAEQHLAKAKLYDNQLLRANILLGDIALRQKRLTQARQYYERAFDKYTAFAQFILPKMLQTLDLSNDHFVAYLKKLRKHTNNEIYVNLYFQELIKTKRTDEIEAFFTALADDGQFPIASLASLLQHEVDVNKIDRADLVTRIIRVLQNHLHQVYLYKCAHCGFESEKLYWQCPSCRYWDTQDPCATTASDKLTRLFPEVKVAR